MSKTQKIQVFFIYRGYAEFENIDQESGTFNKTYPDDLSKQIRQGYYACVSYIDYQYGRVLDVSNFFSPKYNVLQERGEIVFIVVLQHLESLGLANDTIIAFWSDHGISMGENGVWAKFKNNEYSTRVPMMIKVPGTTDHGMETSSLVELVDLFPSLAEAAGEDTNHTCTLKHTY